MIRPKFCIVRVGDINGNIKNSVLERIKEKTSPIWGYNSSNCCGFKTMSNSMHRMLESWTLESNCYMLFLPNKKNNIIGIAKVHRLNRREIGELISLSTTNEENGWNQPTAYGGSNWDIEVVIEKYWDLTMLYTIDDTTFSYDTIQKIHEKRIPQASILYYDQTYELHKYLNIHVSYIINHLQPNYIKTPEPNCEISKRI